MGTHHRSYIHLSISLSLILFVYLYICSFNVHLFFLSNQCLASADPAYWETHHKQRATYMCRNQSRKPTISKTNRSRMFNYNHTTQPHFKANRTGAINIAINHDGLEGNPRESQRESRGISPGSPRESRLPIVSPESYQEPYNYGKFSSLPSKKFPFFFTLYYETPSIRLVFAHTITHTSPLSAQLTCSRYINISARCPPLS